MILFKHFQAVNAIQVFILWLAFQLTHYLPPLHAHLHGMLPMLQGYLPAQEVASEEV